MDCAECGFDLAAWRERDVVTFFDALGDWWEMAVGGALTTGRGRALADLADQAAEELCARAGVAPSGAALPDIATAGAALAASSPPVDSAVHRFSHQMMEVSNLLWEAGTGTVAGRVEQVNTSPGGVPKRPISGGQVGWRGVQGDHQSDRKHHGRPFQAICLWSSEVIDSLAADGHPIFPGAAGENLTVSGLDWPTLRSGALLRVGSTLELEVSWPAVPCANQTRWFTDGDFKRIGFDRDPDLVRWYAWVRRPGPVSSGDTIRRTTY